MQHYPEQRRFPPRGRPGPNLGEAYSTLLSAGPPAHRELIAQAANQLIAWKVKDDDQWRANIKVKRRLAVAISKYVRTRPWLLVNRLSVQLNWVTRHQNEIEQARVEAR